MSEITEIDLKMDNFTNLGPQLFEGSFILDHF